MKSRPVLRRELGAVHWLGALAFAAPLNFEFGLAPWTALRLRPLTIAFTVVTIGLFVHALRRSRLTSFDIVDGWCAAWFLGVAVSTFTSDQPVRSASAALPVGICILLLFVTRRLVRIEDAQRLFRPWVAGLVVAAILGIGLWVWPEFDTSTWFVGEVTTVGLEPRLTHPWPHANIAAMALVMGIACAAALGSRLGALVAVVLVVALALTASRAGLGAMGLAGAVWAWREAKARSVLVLVVPLAVVGLVVGGTDVWAARWESIEPLDYSAHIEAPERVTVGDEPVAITATNTGATDWPSTGEQAVLLSARWLGGDGSVLAEDWWPLANDIPVNESATMRVEFVPRAPVGAYEVRWDLVIPNVLYITEADVESAVTSQVIVPTSPVSTETVERYAAARSQERLGRIDLWRLSWQEFGRSPLTGVGTSMLGRSADSALESNQVSGAHAHNIVLEPLSSWGLIGALPFFVLVATAFRRATRNTGADSRGMRTIVFAGLIGAVAHGMLDWPLVSISTCVPFGILLGLALVHEGAT